MTTNRDWRQWTQSPEQIKSDAIYYLNCGKEKKLSRGIISPPR